MRSSFISINIGDRKLIVTRPTTHLEDYCTQSDMISYIIVVPGSLNAELREITQRLSFVVSSEAMSIVSMIRCHVTTSNATAFEERLSRLHDDYGFPIMLTMGHLRTVVFTGNQPDAVTDSRAR